MMTAAARHTILQQLGLQRWRLRETASAANTDAALEAIAEPAPAAAHTEEQVSPVHGLTLCWPGGADAALQRLVADIEHWCRWQKIPCQRQQVDQEQTLPPAPALCFHAETAEVRQDGQKRLLMPLNFAELPEVVWKPRLWSYLQSHWFDELE